MTKSVPVEILASDLNTQGGIYCPNPKADMKVWNSHPRIYMILSRVGEATCPYCSTTYKLKEGEKVHGGH